MKILIVNSYDHGGAANSCKRLHLGLLNTGVKSKVLLKTKTKNWPDSFQFISPMRPLAFSEKIKNKAQRIAKELRLYFPLDKIHNAEWNFLKSRPVGLEMFSFPQSDYDITESELYQEADIINLHWVANFLDFPSFFKKNTKPVVWTLHDMNPFSGGEHYGEILLGIDESGFPKRREVSAEEKKVTAENIKIKKNALARVDNLTIVAPSLWLAEEAEKSEVFKEKKIQHIPYGLDPEIFYPKDRDKSREFFKVPKHKKVILFVSDSLNKNRKGLMFLKEAFELLEDENFMLCAVGSMESNLQKGKDIMEIGIIEEEELMCAAYSAADVFVIPSLMDNLPNTVLESIMCGTPVIGFPVGGIPEMITNGKNGLITEEISVPSLHRTLVKFFNSIEVFSREEIRKDAVEKYDLKIQANRYISLFHKCTKL